MAGEGGGKARRNSQINGEEGEREGGSIWFPIDARKLGNSCRNN